MRNSHGSCSGCSLCCCSLVDLVLGSLYLGLQMCRRMKIFALFPRASSLDVIHADGYCVVIGVNHCAVSRMSKSTIIFSSVAIATLVLSTYLKSVCPHQFLCSSCSSCRYRNPRIPCNQHWCRRQDLCWNQAWGNRSQVGIKGC